MAKTNPASDPNPNDIPADVREGGKPAACPRCDADVSKAVSVGGLVACPVCARTLVLEQGTARLAKAEDVMSLPESMRVQLRKSRPAAWKENNAARLKAIRGRK